MNRCGQRVRTILSCSIGEFLQHLRIALSGPQDAPRMESSPWNGTAPRLHSNQFRYRRFRFPKGEWPGGAIGCRSATSPSRVELIRWTFRSQYVAIDQADELHRLILAEQLPSCFVGYGSPQRPSRQAISAFGLDAADQACIPRRQILDSDAAVEGIEICSYCVDRHVSINEAGQVVRMLLRNLHRDGKGTAAGGSRQFVLEPLHMARPVLALA